MPRLTPIAFFELDVRWLKRRGLVPGGSMIVSERVNGRPRGAVRVCWPDPSTITVEGSAIDVDYTPVHLGGRRPWFRCPCCDARAAVLYGSPFACRGCQRVAYPSQRQPAHERRLNQAQRIRERLGGSASMVEAFPERPRGMHRSTHDRLWAQYLLMERSSLTMLAGHWHMSA